MVRIYVVKEYLGNKIEEAKDTNFDENVWMQISGKRGTKYYIFGTYVCPWSRRVRQQLFGGSSEKK